MSVQIHIIEANHNLRSLLAWHLQQAGYQVNQSGTLAQAYQHCARELPTLAILASDLPDGEGIEFCQWLYPQGNSLILMLSARIREIDLVSALHAGVDDYLKKPFGMPEFLARVAALLRRSRIANTIPTDLTYGNLRIDLVRRCVYLRNLPLTDLDATKTVATSTNSHKSPDSSRQESLETRIDLSPQEFSLLYVLAQANGRPVHRHELLKRAWDIDIDNPRTVDSHVLTLRKKLGHPDPIETVRKIGYRLNY
ncbi:response regulator transcription factor [Chamaesiphon polymorphus]|uniref:DNA-binding response regulator n=1 Tax=Chamaesiphon polymorphus CCALA 037 TaxID=2107692 RepID=A0A2T1GNJ8_9CYAN|nr:response regulator transcription factor [Chamaesiphon polymorphus]PSB59527.1 DNA-binding response regulator [Chamaesiphon polymorphus CCALA 037]